MFKYFPHTKQDIDEMLRVIGVNDVAELFSEIPSSLMNPDIDVPSSHSELELIKHFETLNQYNQRLIPLMGAGSYDHYIPSIINHLTQRQEFLTSYTPYQPEISQGTLQYIFEYQSVVCELTGMDVSNASMYDGPTATAEAMIMATHHTKRNKILVSSTVLPSVLETLKTYAKYRNIEVLLVEEEGGITKQNDARSKLDKTVAGLIIQSPNKYGIIEPLEGYREALAEVKALYIVNSDLASLSLLQTPGEVGADIAVGEAQSMGIPISFGGPYIGYLATTKKLMRKMPGRICGVTTDVDGKRAFVLTLQAREQHIRREKANSNICSNQSLNALAVTIYAATMGKKGVVQAQQQSIDKTHYLAERLIDTGKFELLYDRPYFKDVALKSTINRTDLIKASIASGYTGPLPLENWGKHLSDVYLFSATEKRTKEEIDRFISVVEAI
jgi:glycine dehydrogenase subunit 1